MSAVLPDPVGPGAPAAPVATRFVDARLLPPALASIGAAYVGMWLTRAWGHIETVMWATCVVIVLLAATTVYVWRSRTPAVAVACMVLLGTAMGGVGVLRAEGSQGAADVRVHGRSGESVVALVRVVGHPKRYGPAQNPLWTCRATSLHPDDTKSAAPTIGQGAHLTLAGEQMCRNAAWGATYRITGTISPPRSITMQPTLRVSSSQLMAAPRGWLASAASARSAFLALPTLNRGDPGALVAGLTIGAEDSQSDALRDDFAVTGLAHLTAVSGTNITIVVGAWWWLAGLVVRSRWFRAAGACVLVTGYVTTVGLDPSVLRAAAMGCVGVLALAASRQATGVAGVCLATCTLAAVHAPIVTSIGFALSASATLGIALGGAPLTEKLRRVLPRPLAAAIAVTVCATTATAPLAVWLAGGVAPLAIVANVVAGVAAAPATVSGVAALVTATWWPELADVAALPAWWCAWWIAQTARVCAGVTGGVWPAWTAVAIVACVLALWGVRRFRRRRWGAGTRHRAPLALPTGRRAIPRVACKLRRAASRLQHVSTSPRLGVRLGVLLALGVSVAIVLLHVEYAQSPPGSGGERSDWFVAVCDVGQGTAVLVRSGPTSAVLFDAGPAGGGVTECIKDSHVERLDALVVSHFHADHVGGVAEVLEMVPVGAVVHGNTVQPDVAVEQVRAAAARSRISVRVATGGVESFGQALVQWSSSPPAECASQCSSDAINDASLAGVAETPWGSAVITGDVEYSGGRRLSDDLVGIGGADVFVIPHHGSARQHPKLFGAAAAPIHIASVGDGNDYGHPADSTLALSRQVGAQVLRTDVHGTVWVTPQSIVTERPPVGS